MGAAKLLCTAFSDLLMATEPGSKEPRQTMLSAASQVGSASHRVLYTIGEEEVADKERQDILLGLAKAVANTTAALVLKAKNVASKCPDQTTQNKVCSTYLVNLFHHLKIIENHLKEHFSDVFWRIQNSCFGWY